MIEKMSLKFNLSKKDPLLIEMIEMAELILFRKV